MSAGSGLRTLPGMAPDPRAPEPRAGETRETAARERADRRLGELLLEHGLIDGPRLEDALRRRGQRGLAGLLVEEGIVPRYAVETLLALGGDGLRPLRSAPGDGPPAGADWRAATTRGAGGGNVSSELGGWSGGGWPSEVFAPTGPGTALLAPRGRLGRFELGPELGHGGGGWVFRARDGRDGREVALKVLRRASDVAVQRFLREAEAVARLRHPHIVPLLERGEDEARHWLAFELVEGRPLHERCEDPDWTPTLAAGVLRDAARALQHAHEQGVLHRDVKPSNLLVTPEGRCRVLDFGLARLEDQASPLTSSGAVLGTVRYMAPEQAFPGSRPLDPRTDVWGLGATLYHALTRRPPFARGPLPGERLLPPRALQPSIPPALERVVLRCLSEDPAARYPDAGALAEDLERFLRGERVRAGHPGRRRAAPLLLAAAALLALVLAGGGIPREAGSTTPAAPGSGSSSSGTPVQAQVEQLLRAASEARDEETLARAGAALGRLAATPAARAVLVARLDELTERLRAAGRTLLATAEEPDPVEMARGEEPLRGLQAALERTRQGLTLRAADRLTARLLRQSVAPPGAEGPLMQAQARAQAEALGPHGRRLARALCLALGRVADPALAPPLARYLDCVAEEAQAIPAAQALVRAGSEPGLRVVLEALRRFGPTSRFAVEALRGAEGARSTRVDPSSWTDLTSRGDLCLTTGDLQGALRDYQRAAGLAPTQSMLWNRLALTWRRLGEDERARACWDVALSLDPGSQEARLNRASDRRERGDLEGAEADLRAVLTAGGDKAARAWVELAMIAAARGDQPEAVRCCDRALAIDPRDPAAWNERGSAHLAQGRLEAAEADYAQAVELEPFHPAPWRNRAAVRARRGDRHGARADANRSLELDPRDPLGWVVRGDVRGDTGDQEGALSDYERALALDPRSESAWTGRGNVLRLRRAWDEAIAAHTRAIELAPRRSVSWMNRAAALQESGRLEEARADLDQALALDPKNHVAWGNRAGLRARLGDLEGAEADASEALRLVPDYAGGLLQRATARLARSELEGARSDLDRAIALEPGLARAWMERGRTRYLAGDLSAAEADFSRSLELDPLSPIAWSNRGALRHRLGRAAEALSDLDRALALDPRQAEAWANRALVHRALGELERALADADRSLDLDPRRPTHLRNRAVIHVQREDLAAADADLTSALELDPLDPDTWQARAGLRMDRGDLEGAAADVEQLLRVAPERALAVRSLRARLERLRAGAP